jgi:ribosomal protein S12 methylthiotransferase accessory factor
VLTFEDHATVLTARPGLLDRLDFLGARGRRSFDSEASPRLCDTEAALERCVAGLRAIGVEALANDLTTPDISSLGLAVVRALAPGMHPISGIHPLPFLGGRRLARAHEVFGVGRDEVLPPGEFNPIPHPLA